MFTVLAVQLKGFEDPAQVGLFNDVDSMVDTNAASNIELFISRIIGGVTILGGLTFLMYFIMGAYEWISAGGDSGKIQKARDKMLQGVTGMVIMIAAYGILGIIGTIVGFDLLNPGKAFVGLINTP
jgi:hypothetical protein